MQTTKLLLLATALVTGIVACKKTDVHLAPPASVTIVHAMASGKTVIPIFGEGAVTYYSSAKTVAYGAAAYYSNTSGYSPFYVVKSTDTLHPIFQGGFDLTAGNTYSLFISGDTTKPDTMFVKDVFPTINDTSAGVRFVNLSPKSAAINVNIKGNAAAKTEFSGIEYRQISDFKVFPAGSAVGGKYIFEIRNQPNDSLLVTYTWTYSKFRSHTLVLGGAVSTAGKPTSLKIFAVNNY